jgi:polysaccharide deacetylase 2 family uncharacterized protein YibQ
MIFVKVFIVDGIDAYRQPISAPRPVAIQMTEPAEPIAEPPKYQTLADEVEVMPYFDFSATIPQPDAFVPPDETVKELAKPEAEIPSPEKESWKAPEPVLRPGDNPKLVIIIDDMGLSRGYTQDIIDLPAPLTLAFLPYAERLEEFTIPAKNKGHELIIHVPMEPTNPDLDLGPHGLRTAMAKEDFKAILRDNIFNAFDGYVGINNHMGSKLTQDTQAMGWVMEELGERNLFFVDSKTIASSIAAKTAAQYNVPFAERDVFLDHYDTIDSVRKALHQLELVAMRKGFGIAIGHPKGHTVKALQEWMPDAAARGFEFVPVSAVIFKPETRAATVPLAVKADKVAIENWKLQAAPPIHSFSPYSDY